jgi:LysM repeat protein
VAQDADSPAAAPEAAAAPEPAPQPPGTRALRHVIARGDTLASIAAKHGVSIGDLKAWNGLADDEIKFGRRLVVYVPDDPAEAASPEAPPHTKRRDHTVAEGETLAGIAAEYGVPEADLRAWNGLAGGEPAPGAVLAVHLPIALPADAPAEAPLGRHVVETGDTLHRIALRYGTTQDALIRLNGLRDPNAIRIGQSLKVPAAPPAP